MTLREETTREMELPDLFALPLDEEGFMKTATALIAIIGRGKTNQFNKKESGAALRSKDVRTCSFGALALYMFQRFEINHEPFPDLSDSEVIAVVLQS